MKRQLLDPKCLNKVNKVIDSRGNVIEGLTAYIKYSDEGEYFDCVLKSEHPNVDVGDLVHFSKTGSAVKKAIKVDYMVTKTAGTINTAVGEMNYKPGDYIINQKGRDMYAVDRDIFLNNYEVLE